MTIESPFIARITHFEEAPIPLRAYIFKNGLDEGFEGSIDLAHTHLLETYSQISNRKFNYLLAVVWFNSQANAKTVDFMGYSGLGEDWKANPEIDPFIFREGMFVPREEKCLENIVPGAKSFCGTTMRMLGREEDYRLTTPDRKTYFKLSPHLGDLEPPVDL